MQNNNDPRSLITQPKMFFGLVILSGFIMAYWHWLSYQKFLHTPIQLAAEQSSITIQSGDSLNLLARKWAQQGLISNQYYFRLIGFFAPELNRIKRGEYPVADGETPLSLLKKISQGRVIQYPFTIIEGMNRYDIVRLIENNPLLNNDLDFSQQDFGTSINPLDSELVSETQDFNIEGWLYPDTYYFSRDEKASQLIARAYQKMTAVLSQQWQLRAENLPYQSAYEALIMASIIEKETGLKSEREKIAGVFVRRLNKKMRLGTDPTVIYGIGPDFNGDITYKDLRTKTPYNTYLIRGLPPTPIAMPSEASIYAALHPDTSEALYFVADGSGGHYFSVTLEEHNRAVDRYIRKKSPM